MIRRKEFDCQCGSHEIFFGTHTHTHTHIPLVWQRPDLSAGSKVQERKMFGAKDQRRKQKFEFSASCLGKHRARTARDAEIQEQHCKRPRTEINREQLLEQLRERMQALHEAHPQSTWVFDCNNVRDDMSAYRERLYNDSGVLVVLNAVTQQEIDDIKPYVGESMVQMYGKEHWPAEVNTALRSGDLYAANPYRNSRSGCGNVGFAYLYKQFTDAGDAVVLPMPGDECVRLAHLPVHHVVLMRLMCENAPRRTALLLSLSETPEHTMISWDSVKVAGGPPHRRMTKQDRTVEHIDEYGTRYGHRTRRLQAIINDDKDPMKLCFVPFTQDTEVRRLIAALLEQPDFFKQHGFKRISGERSRDVIAVLDKFAVAAPPLAMVAWVSGVVHYEAVTEQGADELLPRFHSRQNRTKDRRLRFVIGTHTPTMSEKVCKRLAVVAARGAVPDYNRNLNRDCAPTVYENIMNGKSTQFLKPRQIGEYERAVMERAVSDEGVEEEWMMLPPLYKHCYGVAQPLDTLGFAAGDAARVKGIIREAKQHGST